MGAFNLQVNFPDAQQARILAALKTHWTSTDENGDPVVPSTAEIIEKLRQSVVSSVRDIVRRVERDAAVQAAAAGVADVDAT